MANIITNPTTEIITRDKRLISGRLSRYMIIDSATGIVVEDKEVNVSNLITNQGLRALLTHPVGNGGLFINNNTGTSNSGVLQWCARGIGIGNTQVDTLDLTERIGNFTNTMYFVQGQEFCGTKIVYDNVAGTCKVILRVTHRHENETETGGRNITELGWYMRTSATAHVMFSRVLLPASVHIPIGKYLQTTYDVEIEIPYITETSLSNTDIIGADVPCTARVCCQFPLTNEPFGGCMNDFIAGIRSNGQVQGVSWRQSVGGSIVYGIMELLNATSLGSACASGNDNNLLSTGYTKTLFLNSSASAPFPALGANPVASGTWYRCGNSIPSAGESGASLSAYIEGSYERSLVFTMGVGWPNNIAEVPLGLVIVNGMGYRLYNDADPGAVPTKTVDQTLVLEHMVGWARAT